MLACIDNDMRIRLSSHHRSPRLAIERHERGLATSRGWFSILKREAADSSIAVLARLGANDFLQRERPTFASFMRASD
jgi:hypothetical protein